ncbi:OmpW family protein [Paraburkholderia xenovorans]|uniref:OmpW/AlkL family protein n=1 Tax=Paraburkholderia xenovorans TaxID=36873 RepID=UPI0038B9ADD7
MKNILCAAASVAVLAPFAAHAQSAGSNVVTLGWLHVMPLQSSSPLTTDSAPVPINAPLRLPSTFTSPDTGLHTSNADTVGLTISHFFTDHFAATSVLGVPPTFEISGLGTIRPPGPAGALGSQDIGLPAVNPIVKSVRQWSPALIFQYYFGDATASIRPFLGIGVSYNWFSDVQLQPNFVQQTQQNLGGVMAASAGKPGPTQVSAKASSSWQPVFNAGLTYNFTRHWGIVASVTYIPLKTTSTLTIKAADGTTLAQSSSRLKADPIISYFGVTYRF